MSNSLMHTLRNLLNIQYGGVQFTSIRSNQFLGVKVFSIAKYIDPQILNNGLHVTCFVTNCLLIPGAIGSRIKECTSGGPVISRSMSKSVYACKPTSATCEQEPIFVGSKERR